jgi:hypothetical protein
VAVLAVAGGCFVTPEGDGAVVVALCDVVVDPAAVPGCVPLAAFAAAGARRAGALPAVWFVIAGPGAAVDRAFAAGEAAVGVALAVVTPGPLNWPGRLVAATAGWP